jgi:hypothetical protein
MPKFLNNIDLQKNELQNAVIQVITSSDPSSPKLGQIFFDGDVNQIKVCTNASGPVWEGLAMETADSSTMFNTGLKIGYDSTSLIDFTTDDAVTIRVDNKDSLTFTYANLAITNTTASSATEGSTIELICNDAAALGDDHRLGAIKFRAAEDGSNTLQTGAMIESFADASWTSSENGARMVFSTTDANSATSTVLTLDSNKLATFTGRIITDDTTAATTTTDGSLQTDGGLSVVLDAVIGDDLILISDAAVLSLGAGKDVTITHDNGTGGTLASAGNFVVDSTGGTLTLDGNSGVSIAGGSSEIDVTTTGALDLNSGGFTLDSSTLAITTTDNASVNVTGTTKTLDIDATGAITIDSGTSISIGANADKPIDIDSTTLDIDASGAITIDSTSTISIDGANDVNLSVTSSTGGEDLTIQQIGANDSSIVITAAGTGADAVKIDATAGSMLIAPGLVNGKTLTIGPSSATQMVFTPSATAASEKISIINSSGTADDAIKIDAASGGLTLAAGNDSLIIDADGTDADALQLSSAGGIDIASTGGAGKDINIDASGSVHIKSTESASDSIKIHSTIGGVKILADAAAAGEDIVIEATGSSVKLKSTESTSDAIVLESTLGGIDILASGAAAGEDIDIIATGSSVNITSTEDAANAIYLHANGGTSETILIHSDLGTGNGSVAIKSDAGGITLTSAASKEIKVGTISGAPISIGHTTSETTVNDNLTVTGNLAINGGTTYASSSANEPVVEIKNTHADATAGELRFTKDGATGDTNDLMGTISFYGTDDAENAPQKLAHIDSIITAADTGAEQSSMRFYVAETDGTETLGLSIIGTGDDGEVDVTIGAGVGSTTTISGNLTVSGATTTVSSATLSVTDDLITCSKGNDTIANADGSGLEIDATEATNIHWKYTHATTAWESNVGIGTSGVLTGASLVCTAAATFGGGYGSTGATISTAGIGTFNGALTTDGALTGASLVCTAAATFGGGYGSTGATISTAGVGTFNGALTTDGALTGASLVCTAAATFGGGYGSTGATISTAGVGTFNGALTTDGALTAASAVIGGGYGSTGASVSAAGVGQFNGALTTDGALTGASLVCTAAATFGGGYGSTGATISTAGVGTFNGALTTDGALTGASLVCTAAATFGGGYGSTGATISTAGIGTFNGALTTDGALTADNIVCTNAATFGGGYGSTGATVSTAGVGTFNGALTTDGALTADNIVCTNAITIGGGTGSTGATISTAGVGTFDGNVTALGYNVALAKSFVLDHDTTDVAAASDGDTDSLTFTITHGFPATFMVKAEILTNSGNYDTVFADVTRPTNGTVLVTFATAVVNGDYVALLTRVG